MQYIQKHLEVLPTLAQTVSKVDNFEDAIAVALRHICTLTAFEYAEAWIPSPNNAFLELNRAWYKSEYQDEKDLLSWEQFRLCSEGFIFPAGIGLPGRVYVMQQPEWIEDVSAESESSFLRNQIAKAFGVRTAFGIPVSIDQQIFSVLVFFKLEALAEDKQTLEIALSAAEELAPLLLPLCGSNKNI